MVITADHGEHLGEQGLFGHGCSLYMPELHVPLIVLGPGLIPPGQAVSDPVSLRDLSATLLDLLGLETEAPIPGRSLACLWNDEPRPNPDRNPVVSELAGPPEQDPNHGESPVCRGRLTSVVDGRWHLIRRADGREELYDLDRDPGESHNLADQPRLAEVLEETRSLLKR